MFGNKKETYWNSVKGHLAKLSNADANATDAEIHASFLAYVNQLENGEQEMETEEDADTEETNQEMAEISAKLVKMEKRILALEQRPSRKGFGQKDSQVQTTYSKEQRPF